MLRFTQHDIKVTSFIETQSLRKEVEQILSATACYLRA
jgi:hypothetical protein